MNQEDLGYKITPLGELQWWSLEVISGTIFALGVGIFAGREQLGLLKTLLLGAAVLLGVFMLGALLRRVSNSRSIYINASPAKVFDAVLANAGRGPFLRSLWGISLNVERSAELMKRGATIETTYTVGTDALSVRSSRKGELTITVDEMDPPHKVVQHVVNKFRGRTSRSIGVTILEPENGGTRVTERTRLIMPMNASHFIGAVYARLVVSRASKSYLQGLKRSLEGRGG